MAHSEILHEPRKPWVYRIEHAVAWSVYGLSRLFGRKTLLRIGKRLGLWYYNHSSARREVARHNLDMAFGNTLSHEERERIVINSFINFGKVLGDFLALPRLSDRQVNRIIRHHNIEILQKAHSRGKGVMFLSGHFGPWALGSWSLGRSFARNTFLIGTQKNSRVNELVKQIRQKRGIPQVPIGAGMREIIKRLKKGELITSLNDQDAGTIGQFTQFFGQPASTARGPAKFHHATGCALVFFIALRRKDDTFDNYIEEICWQPCDNKEEESRRILQSYSDILEKYIRAHPEQWMWFHRRWKTRKTSDMITQKTVKTTS